METHKKKSFKGSTTSLNQQIAKQQVRNTIAVAFIEKMASEPKLTLGITELMNDWIYWIMTGKLIKK